MLLEVSLTPSPNSSTSARGTREYFSTSAYHEQYNAVDAHANLANTLTEGGFGIQAACVHVVLLSGRMSYFSFGRSTV
jgi:hypothetical protein